MSSVRAFFLSRRTCRAPYHSKRLSGAAAPSDCNALHSTSPGKSFRSGVARNADADRESTAASVAMKFHRQARESS